MTASRTTRAGRRLFDLFGALLLLLLFGPLMAAIALLIWLTSGRPVVFCQRRVTRDGAIFTMLKFRTMFPAAEARTGPVWARHDDPRCTRLGRLLRRLSLDELPQLFNVLEGSMSLVGPRPERPVFVMRFRRQLPRYDARHAVKAGITGWAQINGWRGDTALLPRLAHDLHYVEKQSLAFDLWILWRTALLGFVNRRCPAPAAGTGRRSDTPGCGAAGASTI